MKKLILIMIIGMAITAAGATADHVVTSQFGYHPDSTKRAIIYTDHDVPEITIHDTGTGAVIATYALAPPTNYEGEEVACQGNQPCLVADFTSFTTPGDYYLSADGHATPIFTISNDIYERHAPTLLEYYEATLQQGSDYHPDYHSAHEPSFPIMADGSFILEAEQAASTIIRLGSAYRQDPSLFATDNHDTLAPGKGDLAEYITIHAQYLMELQGLQLQARDDGTGIRTGTGFRIENAFTPGPATQSSARVYYSNQGGGYEDVSVKSMCGADDASQAWDDCMQHASQDLKCQADETCLNLTYDGPTASISGREGYDVAKGWSYEFQCYPDMPADQEAFAAQDDRCLIFSDDTNQNRTSRTAFALMQALPAAHAVDEATAQQMLKRAINTRDYVQGRYGELSAQTQGWLGATEFLIYDATGEDEYLLAAHERAQDIDTFFDIDGTHANEYYWEEYVRHRADIESRGLTYPVAKSYPEEFFRGKMWFDFKDRWVSISDNGEYVLDSTPGAGDFQESRPMLVEAVFAEKTMVLHQAPEYFVPLIADSQLAWLTGANRVQDGISNDAPLRAYSFIHGIGDNPQSQHTRLQLDSGVSERTGGAFAGVRSTQFFFEDPDAPGTYKEYDGITTILGQRFGSAGNQWREETYNDPFITRSYANGKEEIPGWVSGAYDVGTEQDIIFNFDDDTGSWRFTESTDEIVAAAVELLAYQDARHNDRPRAPMPQYDLSALDLADDGLTYDPMCGNGILEAGEACDDGNTVSGDGCSSTCELEVSAVCGNGVVESGESCDDGNTLSGDGCSSTCEEEATDGCAYDVHDLAATCTDGTITADDSSGSCRSLTCEGTRGSISVLACDKPDTGEKTHYEMYKTGSEGDAPQLCLGNTCLEDAGYARSAQDYPVCDDAAVCGNGVVEAGESCDDGNTLSGDGCSSTCELEASAVCGNGVLEAGESCDDGNTLSGDGCSSTCEEEVADGCAHSIGALSANCVGGTKTQDETSGACRSITCESAQGALSVLACDKPDEYDPAYFEMYRQAQTDDGLDVCLGDTCLQGWGYKQGSSYPVCDDGAACGNGILEAGESCDDGNTLSGDGCSSTCEVESQAVCGNGVLEAGESCDDGNTLSGDGCSSTCEEEATDGCANSIGEVEATCTGGTITTDNTGGACRTLVCEDAQGSLSVLACDKPDGEPPQYFEMYKQEQTGEGVESMCLGQTCITNGQYDGYARSDGYATCA